MNNRDNTNFDSTIPGDATISGVRPVSMGSIALLQLTNNPVGTAILGGKDIPFDDCEAMLQFAYIHTHDIKEITPMILRFKSEPELFISKVLEWGMDITPDDMLNIYMDIMRDRDNIKNSRTLSIKDPKDNSKSKNELGQQ